MTTIYVPSISPFSVKGPLHEADDSHIQSHHVAYEIANHSRKLCHLVSQYEAQVAVVTALQEQAAHCKISKNKGLGESLKAAEKVLLASQLPYEIKMLKTRIGDLNADLMVLTASL